jgi:glycyl-tRNA synthetase alpha subunit
MNNAEQNSISTQKRLTNSEELDLEKFKLSRTSQPIASLSTALVIDELINGMQKLGVKADKMPNNADMLIMYKSIMEEYPNIKIGEISLAFDLAAKGKLDIEAETYQNFSMLYLHRLLRAFARYGMQKLNEIKPVEESKWQPRFITDDEKIETAFDCYSKFKQWDNIVFGVDVFNILHKRGSIIVTPSETYEKVIEEMTKKMFEGSRQDKIDVKNKMKDDDYMENQCRRMAVSQYFTKLINRG